MEFSWEDIKIWHHKIKYGYDVLDPDRSEVASVKRRSFCSCFLCCTTDQKCVTQDNLCSIVVFYQDMFTSQDKFKFMNRLAVVFVYHKLYSIMVTS